MTGDGRGTGRRNTSGPAVVRGGPGSVAQRLFNVESEAASAVVGGLMNCQIQTRTPHARLTAGILDDPAHVSSDRFS